MEKTGKAYSKDYHDYFIKDGKLVGDFDNMYRHSETVPWKQDEHCHMWYTETGLLMIRDNGPYDSLLEIGCGMGYISAKLKEILKPTPSVMHATDVSATAIAHAKKHHKGIEFFVDDVTSDKFKPRQTYDLVIVKELFWCVINRLAVSIANIKKTVEPGGHLFIGQSFPALEKPYVGKDLIPNHDALINYFPEFERVAQIQLRNFAFTGDGPALQVLLRRVR